MGGTGMAPPIATARTPPVPPPPETPPSEILYEIIDGCRVELPLGSAYASLVAFELAQEIARFAEKNDLGIASMETLFHLNLPADRNRRPDVAFVSFERWPRGRRMDLRAEAWDVVPDLAVEVVSPIDLAEELLEKLDEYLRSGVRQVWIVYPNRRLVFIFDSLTSVRVLAPADELDGGAILPGLRLPVASLFPESEGA
jgi:Uma2 family endonuclease